MLTTTPQAGYSKVSFIHKFYKSTGLLNILFFLSQGKSEANVTNLSRWLPCPSSKLTGLYYNNEINSIVTFHENMKMYIINKEDGNTTGPYNSETFFHKSLPKVDATFTISMADVGVSTVIFSGE